MATVRLPRSLGALFPGLPRLMDLPEADTVAALIAALDARWPGLRDRLCEGPALREHINVFVDGERVGYLAPVGREAVVVVLPAVSGG